MQQVEIIWGDQKLDDHKPYQDLEQERWKRIAEGCPGRVRRKDGDKCQWRRYTNCLEHQAEGFCRIDKCVPWYFRTVWG